MYDENNNNSNMWPQQHQQQFMGPIPPHHTCLQSPSPSSSSSASSSLHQFDAHANQRLDNHVAPQQQQQQHPHHIHGVMELPIPSNPRASRNMAEKQRRDNLNANISTMAALVPAVAGSSRRMDKISILRLAAAFLRSQYTLGPGPETFLPRQYDFDLEQYIIENLIANAGFFFVVTTPGKIVYVSRSIENQLGHAQHELLGQSLYNFVCPEDYEELRRNLSPDFVENSTSGNVCSVPATTEDNSSSSMDDHPAGGPPKTTKNFTEQRRSFNIRMSQKALNKREHGQYECLQISGHLRLANACTGQETNSGRSTHREINATGNDIVFVGVARLVKRRTITELSLLEATKDEYVTRHLVDGRIIFCDHRISVVAGYMTEEVSGLSAFKFMHKEDVRWTIIALRQMYDRGEGFGSSCYRLLSKTGQFIYLRTHGYLEFDKDTQTVESFVCVNTLVSEQEGMKLVKEMKDRFSAVISGPARAIIAPSTSAPLTAPDSQRVDPKATVEDPVQLEAVITELISDLSSPSVLDDRLSPSPLPDNQYYKAAIFSQGLPPASVQASKVGIKLTDCKSPPDTGSSYGKTGRDGRRNSVLNSRVSDHIATLRGDDKSLAIAGPSFADNYDKKVEINSDNSETRESRPTITIKTENQRIIDAMDDGESSTEGKRVVASKTEDILYGANSSGVCHSPGKVAWPVFKPSNNNLQEKRNPRRRVSHTNIQQQDKERRYNSGKQQAHGKNANASHRLDTIVSSTCEVLRNRDRGPMPTKGTIAKAKYSANEIAATNNATQVQRSNDRKRSRSVSDELTPSGSAAISKRKAIEMTSNFVSNDADDDDDDDDDNDNNSDRIMNIYYPNSTEPLDIGASFIGSSPISSCTDDLAGAEENRLNVREDEVEEEEQEEEVEEEENRVAAGIAIEDLGTTRKTTTTTTTIEGGSRLGQSIDVYQHFNTSRLLDSSDSVQQIDDDDADDELEEDLREGRLSPSLDADPDLMKTFEDLQSVMYNGKTIDEANVNQFTASDEAVNEGIRRSQFQLEKSIALRESQLSVLKRDLKRDLDNPALQAQRKNFTQLQAEHNKQKQMLKTLQQEHLTLQANVQHNVGV